VRKKKVYMGRRQQKMSKISFAEEEKMNGEGLEKEYQPLSMSLNSEKKKRPITGKGRIYRVWS